MHGSKLFAILLAGALAACSNDAPTAARATPAHAQPIIGVTDRSVAAIDALVAAYEATWASDDAAAYAALFAEDAQIILAAGALLSGRPAIQAYFAGLFGGVFQPSTRSLAIRRVQFLTGTIAIVDLDTELSGYTALPPGLRDTEPGVFRTRERWVLEKRAGDWQIVAMQRTPIPPAS